MDIQKFRIKRVNSAQYASPVCSGSTNLWPINLSTTPFGANACQDIPMYTSLGSQVTSAINGDMTSFPDELKDCDTNNPCVILWNTTGPTYTQPAIPPFYCTDANGDVWVKFKGLQYWSAGTPTIGSYNELFPLYSIYGADPSINILGQLGGWWDAFTTPCLCEDPYEGEDLSHVPVFMTQDFNDIGHYSVWDGNIGQKEIFSNFLFTGLTPYFIQVFNTTDFEFYEDMKNSSYTITWGNGPTSTLVWPNLTATNLYPMIPATYQVTITLQTPWGPVSTSKLLTIPNLTFLNMLGQPFTPGGGGLLGTGGLQNPQNTVPLQGPPIYDNDPFSPTFGQLLGHAGGSTAYHSYYGTGSTAGYLPLDSGTNIIQYSGMSVTPCFEVTGVTQSSLGLFQTYSSAPSNSPFLPAGYFEWQPLTPYVYPLGGDVLNPTTNVLESQLEGFIHVANASFTGYTIQSSAVVPYPTPIDFYDFSNGITVFVAQSCGLDANAFGGEDCYQCLIESCLYCEEKDEYIQRVPPYQPVLIAFQPANTNYASLGSAWSPNIDYITGDIVFDTTGNMCCCFMAVKDINQSNPSTQSPWAGTPPALTNLGVWNNPVPGQPDEHIWEACCYAPDCNCAACPTGTLVPCNDPTLPAIWGGPNSANGGVYQNGNVYNVGQFISDTTGNCYRALQTGPLNPPTGATGNLEWEYTGCISWICPTDPLSLGMYGCEMISGSSVNIINAYFPAPGMVFIGNMFYQQCIDDLNAVPTACPYPERWVCEDRYGCGSCVPIYPGGSVMTNAGLVNYNHPGYPFSVVFSSQTDCNSWCNPPIYSCSTPTAPCCSQFDCSNPPLYASLTAAIPYNMSPANVLANFNLYLGGGNPISTPIPPYYTLGDCQNTCCVETYDWDCETGCTMSPFAVTPAVIPPSCVGIVPPNVPQTLAYCECLNGGTGLPGGMQVPPVACGWSCTTPTMPYNPLPANPMGLVPPVYLSPCTPCYTNNCAPYMNEISCVSGCNDTLNCYVCNCDSTVQVQNLTPCPTPITPGAYIYGPNNGIDTGVYWPNGQPIFSYSTFSAASASCECIFGWDCWVINDPLDPNHGQPDGNGCFNYPASNLVPVNLTASTGGPYSSWTACCIATNCCYARCDWQVALTTTYSNNVQPWGYYPCIYDNTAPNVMSCDPTVPSSYPLLDYCTIQDCYATENPTDNMDAKCNEDPPGECYCCSAYTWDNWGYSPPLNHRGTWTTPAVPAYNMFDTVSWMDPDTPFCCFVCACPSFGPGGSPGTYDCNDFVPGDGPAPNGQANCWQNCTYVPTQPPYLPIFYYNGNVLNDVDDGHCPACDPAYTATTYMCTWDGCVDSSTVPGGPCVINGSFTYTSQNCYPTNTCIGNTGQNDCIAGCYCQEGPGGSPPAPWNMSACVVLQDFLNQADNIYLGGYPTYPPTVPPAGAPNNPPNYNYSTLNACLLVVNVQVDCCDDPRYYCENGSNCLPPMGTGCVTLYPGDPNYNLGPFTSLSDCQAYCRWECNELGLQQCQFVPASTAIPFYLSAAACLLANPRCDCKLPVEYEWWCDTSGFVGTTPGSTNCVMNVVGNNPPNPTQSWGLLSPAFTQPCLFGTPNCYSFGSLGLCEGWCRFCCDPAPPGTSFCQLSWGTPSCDISLYDCQQTAIMLYGSYPCYYVPGVEFCCDPITGCQSFTGPVPFGCGAVFTSMADCQAECHFVCGVCIQDCVCTHITGLLPAPCTPVDSYSSMTNCNLAVSLNTAGIVGFDPDYPACCTCYNCVLQGSIAWQYLDLGVWTWTSTPVLYNWPPNPTPPIWAANTPYTIGQVVFAGAQAGADPTCCYVLVADWGVFNQTLSPSEYYNLYLTDISNNVQTLYNSAVWIPCNPDCPDVYPIFTWDCDPGFYVNNCSGMKQAKHGDGICTCYQDPMSVCGGERCVARTPRDVVFTYAHKDNNAGPSFNCSGGGGGVGGDLANNCFSYLGAPTGGCVGSSRLWELVNSTSATTQYCCEGCHYQTSGHPPNSDGGCWMKIKYMQIISGEYVNPSSSNYCVQMTQQYYAWSNFISALNFCGFYPGGTPWIWTAGGTYNADGPTVFNFIAQSSQNGGEPKVVHEMCECEDIPCNCYQVAGLSGQYANQSLCEQDCCQKYTCLATPACFCYALPLYTNGPYNNMADCLNDTTTCCSGSTYECPECTANWPALPIYQQILDGTGFNPYVSALFVNPPTFNAMGYVSTWSPWMNWGFNEMALDPYDGCCYISIGDYPGGLTSAWPPSVCYANFLLGLACDGSNVGSPTPTTLAQGDYSVWWPCDALCPNDNPPAIGCTDCQNVFTSQQLGGVIPPNFQTYTWNTNYTVGDCVVEPEDNCCWCCINQGIINPIPPDGSDNPNSDNNQGSQGMVTPGDCKIDSQGGWQGNPTNWPPTGWANCHQTQNGGPCPSGWGSGSDRYWDCIGPSGGVQVCTQLPAGVLGPYVDYNDCITSGDCGPEPSDNPLDDTQACCFEGWCFPILSSYCTDIAVTVYPSMMDCLTSDGCICPDAQIWHPMVTNSGYFPTTLLYCQACISPVAYMNNLAWSMGFCDCCEMGTD